MDSTDVPDRVTLLERLAAQQLTMNDSILELTALVTREQALHAARLAQHDASLARHEDLMARLAQTLDAIKYLLDRGNGH